MTSNREIHGLLFDLDGVLYVGNDVIPGALETLGKIRRAKIPCRFITNTSTKTATDVAVKLKTLGFRIQARDIFSAVSATRDFLREVPGDPAVHFLIHDAAKPEFAAFRQDSPQPDYVVVGDIGAAWNYVLLNRVFNELMGGAELIAMHKNKYWQVKNGLQMDIGAFVAGLEFVSGKQAIIIGKPSQAFFQLAARHLGVEAHKVLVIGDDIDNDIGGGQAAGLKAALVKTGKYRRETAENSGITPFATLDSVADLPDLLNLPG
ncbi:MAG: TIGR01458 family HAD-type hydrolase [Pseudohongiellaceae bacterium]